MTTNRKKKLLRLRKSGLGYKLIAKKSGLSREQVREFLLNAGTAKPLTGARRSRILQWRKKGLGYRAIASKTGLKRDQVRNFLMRVEKKGKRVKKGRIRKRRK